MIFFINMVLLGLIFCVDSTLDLHYTLKKDGSICDLIKKKGLYMKIVRKENIIENALFTTL